MIDPVVGGVAHDVSLRHDAGARHPERPDRLRVILGHLHECGTASRMQWHEPAPASDALIRLAHDVSLLDLLRSLDTAGGGQIDIDTAMNPASLEATLRASQGAADAVAKVLDGSWTSGFVLMRPPGHHAGPATPMGFCLTNHVAVAARWALREGGLERVAVVDWDAHHGNGTQDIFYADPDVLYVSLHQYPWYPGTGDVTETGAGAGTGTTVNVPLPAGSAEDAYARAFDEVVEPALRSFGPDLVLVSAGYDAHVDDPLCMMRLTAGAFFRLTRRVDGIGRGPVCVLEGGYDLGGLASSVGATVSALLGDDVPAGVSEAELEPLGGTDEAGPWIDRAVAVHR